MPSNFESGNVPLRGLVPVLAVTDHVTDPLAVPLGGEQVNQLGALLCGVQEQPAAAVTLNVPLPAAEPALALVRYTHRQRRAFENIRFVLEEQLEGSAREIPGMDADRVYADSVARPIREAQALVSGRQTAVIRRLLGYLKPYRRQLALGMTAATVITLVSLVPPYLAGTLIDRVVRPAQAGTLPLSRAITIAWLAVTAMAVVYLVKQAAAYVRLRLMAILGEWVARDLRDELYEHIQRLSRREIV